MHRTAKYSQHSSIFWPVWLNGWMFVYELSGCGFESHCSHLIIDLCSCICEFWLVHTCLCCRPRHKHDVTNLRNLCQWRENRQKVGGTNWLTLYWLVGGERGKFSWKCAYAIIFLQACYKIEIKLSGLFRETNLSIPISPMQLKSTSSIQGLVLVFWCNIFQ